MSMSSGSETFGGRPRSDVNAKPPRYQLKRVQGEHHVIDTHQPEGEQTVFTSASWVEAELTRSKLQSLWVAEKQ